MRCKLKILSRGEGWENCLDEAAEIKIGAGSAEITYPLEGDSCRLYLSESFAEHLRKGENNIKITFIPQKYSVCTIGEGGSYEIYTEKLFFQVGKFGCRARLEYRSGNDGERIAVEINAYVLV